MSGWYSSGDDAPVRARNELERVATARRRQIRALRRRKRQVMPISALQALQIQNSIDHLESLNQSRRGSCKHGAGANGAAAGRSFQRWC